MVATEDRRQKSFPKLQYPILRDNGLKTAQQWLKGKQLQDGAEGLWRIHDSLYDLTGFIQDHPGGSQWLKVTKGSDITELFETHHLNENTEKLLPKYFVRNTKSPRHSPFTFKKDGFYKTLKPKIVAKLKDLPPKLRTKSDAIVDTLLLALIVLSPLSCWMWTKNFVFAAVITFINSFILNAVTVCGHNYFHRKDSWRMYVFNLSGLSYEDWRITHAMSHHMHTNTLQDMELSMLEPILNFMPDKNKPLWAQLGAFYFPIIYPFTILGLHMKELVAATIKFENKKISWANAIPFLVPVWMWLAGGLSLLATMAVWLPTLMITSFFFMVFGLTAGHHSSNNFFDGDIPRNESMDWGLHQMDTIEDRIEYSENIFMTLTTFGDHALHHLFPTLDHAEIKYLYPVLLEHCEKFQIQLKRTDIGNALVNNFKQLFRKTLNDFSKQ